MPRTPKPKDVLIAELTRDNKALRELIAYLAPWPATQINFLVGAFLHRKRQTDKQK